jgi:hypothetical protein
VDHFATSVALIGIEDDIESSDVDEVASGPPSCINSTNLALAQQSRNLSAAKLM